MAYNKFAIPTFENRYKYDIQMQYANDEKFHGMFVANLSIFAQTYVQTMQDFCEAFGNVDTDNLFVLNSIGSLLGVSSYEAYLGLYPTMTLDDYKFVIRSKQAQKQFDGTTYGMYRLLSELLPNTQILIKDNDNMSVSVAIYGTNLSALTQTLIDDGEILPKVAGVSYSVSVVSFEPSYWNYPDGQRSGKWGVTIWANDQEAELNNLTNTEWLLNDTLDFSMSVNKTYDIDFETDGLTFSGFGYNGISSPYSISYGLSSNYVYINGSWLDQTARHITISGGADTQDQDLIAWLMENAQLIV